MVIPVSARITTDEKLATCPACERDIIGEFMVEFSPQDGIKVVGDDQRAVQLNGTLIGVKVTAHDCQPKAVRKRTPAKTTKAAGPANPTDDERAITHRAQLGGGIP